MFHQNWRDLIKPREVSIDQRSKAETYTKFVCEPLESGYGITVGNALRRILLSSIVGSAVTKLKLEGALHEFTSLPEIKEDVSDIVLNLKELRLHLLSDEQQVIDIDIEGPKVVTGADIGVSGNVEVLNQDHVIATVSEGGRLQMQLTVDHGRGYVPANQNKDDEDPIGTIAIDSLFSPIRKVNYKITNARVGRRTDYDKLTLEVWTDGSVHPEDAVAYAAKILKEQLTIFINFDETVEPQVAALEEVPEFNENLLKPISELDLSVRGFNCLQSAGIEYVGDLVQKTEPEMLKTKNFGRKSLKEIRELLAEMDLELGAELENWPPKDLEKLSAEA